MKTNQIVIVFLFMILISCGKDESVMTELKGESGLSYNESFSKWTDMKKKNGNSYIYQTTIVSWFGYGSITELKIENGVVASRSYQQFKTDGTNGQREIIDSYSETKVELGSHEKGATPFTIDELYDSCASEYLIVDQDKNTLYFEAESDGLMTLCGFVPDGCMDDCFSGVRINSFKWIN
jgi:hypothetical protein